MQTFMDSAKTQTLRSARNDYDTVMFLIENGMPLLSNIQDKNVVLILGNTGEGKSTFINYMLGSKMISREGIHGGKIDTLGPSYTAIGHCPITSQTLYPQIFEGGPLIVFTDSEADYLKQLNQWQYNGPGTIICIRKPTTESHLWQIGVLKQVEVKFISEEKLKNLQANTIYLYQTQGNYECKFISLHQGTIITYKISSGEDTSQAKLIEFLNKNELTKKFDFSAIRDDLIQITSYYNYNPQRKYELYPLAEGSPLLQALESIHPETLNHYNKNQLLSTFKQVDIQLLHSNPSNEQMQLVTRGKSILLIRKVSIPDEQFKIHQNKTKPERDRLRGETKGNNLIYLLSSRDGDEIFICRDGTTVLPPEELEPELLKLVQQIEDVNHPASNILEQIISLVGKALMLPLSFDLGFRKKGGYVQRALKSQHETLINYLQTKEHEELVEETFKNEILETVATLGGSHYPILPFNEEGYMYYHPCFPAKNFIFCDFQGFKETRGTTIDAWNNLSMEWAIKSTQQVKSVFLVMSYQSLANNKGGGVRDLMLSLARLFHLENYVLNVMTPFHDIQYLSAEPTESQQNAILTSLNRKIYIYQNNDAYKAGFVGANQEYKEIILEFPEACKEVTREVTASFIEYAYPLIEKQGGLLPRNTYCLEVNEQQKWELTFYNDWKTKTPEQVAVFELSKFKIKFPLKGYNKQQKRTTNEDIIDNGSLYWDAEEKTIHCRALSGNQKLILPIKQLLNEESNNFITKYALQNFSTKDIIDLLVKIKGQGGFIPPIEMEKSSKNELDLIQIKHQEERFKTMLGSVHIVVTKAQGHVGFQGKSMEEINQEIFTFFSQFVRKTLKPESKDAKETSAARFLETLTQGPQLYLASYPLTFDEKQEVSRGEKILIIKDSGTYHLGYAHKKTKNYQEVQLKNAQIIEILKQKKHLFISRSLYFPEHTLVFELNQLLQANSSLHLLSRQFTVLDVLDEGIQRKAITQIIENHQGFDIENFNFKKNRWGVDEPETAQRLYREQERLVKWMYEKVIDLYYRMDKTNLLKNAIENLQAGYVRKHQEGNCQTLNGMKATILKLEQNNCSKIIYKDNYYFNMHGYMAASIFSLSIYHWLKRDKIYSYKYKGGIPYSQIIRTTQGGSITNEVVKKAHGYYSGVFKVDELGYETIFGHLYLIAKANQLYPNRLYLNMLKKQQTEFECLPDFLSIIYKTSPVTKDEKQDCSNWKKIIIYSTENKYTIYFLNIHNEFISLVLETYSRCKLKLVEKDEKLSKSEQESIARNEAIYLLKREKHKNFEFELHYQAGGKIDEAIIDSENNKILYDKIIAIDPELFVKTEYGFEYEENDIDALINAFIVKKTPEFIEDENKKRLAHARTTPRYQHHDLETKKELKSQYAMLRNNEKIPLVNTLHNQLCSLFDKLKLNNQQEIRAETDRHRRLLIKLNKLLIDNKAKRLTNNSFSLTNSYYKQLGRNQGFLNYVLEKKQKLLEQIKPTPHAWHLSMSLYTFLTKYDGSSILLKNFKSQLEHLLTQVRSPNGSINLTHRFASESTKPTRSSSFPPSSFGKGKQFSFSEPTDFSFFPGKEKSSSISIDSDTLTQNLLAFIAKNESKELLLRDNIYIDVDKIASSLGDKNSYYTGELIDLLLHPLTAYSDIKIYPSITPEILVNFSQVLQVQTETYAFVPMNVGYDDNTPNHKNHWVALIIDTQYKQFFYLDPAQKTAIPVEVETLRGSRGYTKAVLCNPIDFQQAEKAEGWIRHCGAYLIEIFNVFSHAIQEGKPIAGFEVEDPAVLNCISLKAALSKIQCGEAEAICQIRSQHIEQVDSILSNFIGSTPNKGVL